ncbi:uncharacterized protein Z519_12636 [Cladophialophora bantiana CBS 173.52]|uniref:Kinesin light chain n=1 Tax=Cladophialophora bantiana (strain ATCC 10958 / CBS 173.52 / CDC B-1940 / NIH 8579) TaxID=1442370 RepID=A0A0D2H0B9_CLAB1|nr:uncharacterized protein Z519_12636 [Cladophialophora bantiana CBS 173.52]KIW86723.1 hypothetical protein Z519_12636 [Cladophialophora bantiana CBS 173.52]
MLDNSLSQSFVGGLECLDGNLVRTNGNQGRLIQAEELQVQVMETRLRVLGPDHPDTLTSMANLAFTLNDQDREEGAVQLMISRFKLHVEVLGDPHNDTECCLAAPITWVSLQDMQKVK